MLKKCPHCGGKAELVSRAAHGHTFWRAVCTACGCGTWSDPSGYGHMDGNGAALAVQEWNQRAQT